MADTSSVDDFVTVQTAIVPGSKYCRGTFQENEEMSHSLNSASLCFVTVGLMSVHIRKCVKLGDGVITHSYLVNYCIWRANH